MDAYLPKSEKDVFSQIVLEIELVSPRGEPRREASVGEVTWKPGAANKKDYCVAVSHKSPPTSPVQLKDQIV